MSWRKPKTAARRAHPDPGIELRLQQIISLQQAIDRRQGLITEYLAQMTAARHQQDKASAELRATVSQNRIQEFEAAMKAQNDRITAAGTGITEAEMFITAKQAEIASLTSKLSDSDLSFL